MPNVLLAVLEEENVYSTFDNRKINTIHINKGKGKFGFLKLCWHQGKEEWFVNIYRCVRNFNPHTNIDHRLKNNYN